MKNIKTLILSVPFAASVFFLICMREHAIQGALYGLQLCGRVIIPSVFPFMVLTRFFFSSGMCSRVCSMLEKPFGYVFGVSGEGASVVLLGLISGYPVCTHLTASLYGEKKIGISQAQALISYTNNATPAFIIGYIGSGILGDRDKGVLMYVCIVLSALTYGILTSKKIKNEPAVQSIPQKYDLSRAFTESVSAGSLAALSVCGFIIVFSVISSALALLPEPAASISMLLCELTVGVERSSVLSALLSPRLYFSVLCGAVSLSGGCVLFQVRSACCDICSIKPYIMGKSIQAIFSFFISYALFPLFF